VHRFFKRAHCLSRARHPVQYGIRTPRLLTSRARARYALQTAQLIPHGAMRSGSLSMGDTFAAGSLILPGRGNDMKKLIQPEPETVNHMNSSPRVSFASCAICLAILLALLVLATGCTQPGPVSVPSPFPAATTQTPAATQISVTKPDASHILVTYQGGTDLERLIEIDATVTDSQGKSSTQHIGSKTATTPVTIGGTIKFEGSYSGSNHVIITGYYVDGSSQVLQNTNV